jgi:hypothetical protein
MRRKSQAASRRRANARIKFRDPASGRDVLLPVDFAAQSCGTTIFHWDFMKRDFCSIPTQLVDDLIILWDTFVWCRLAIMIVMTMVIVHHVVLSITYVSKREGADFRMLVMIQPSIVCSSWVGWTTYQWPHFTIEHKR